MPLGGAFQRLKAKLSDFRVGTAEAVAVIRIFPLVHISHGRQQGRPVFVHRAPLSPRAEEILKPGHNLPLDLPEKNRQDVPASGVVNAKLSPFGS
ncbi:MAG TPA: hypothetical protein VJN48_05900 [Terriglobales bacterium]|nr:hypothetical protein [Terriglobales bacterium]